MGKTIETGSNVETDRIVNFNVKEKVNGGEGE